MAQSKHIKCFLTPTPEDLEPRKMTPKYERQPTTLHIIRRGLSIPYPLMVDLNIPHTVTSCGLYTYNASFDIPELFLKIFRIPITPNEASNHVSTWTTIINESSLAFDLLSWNTSGIFSFYFFGGVEGVVGVRWFEISICWWHFLHCWFHSVH